MTGPPRRRDRLLAWLVLMLCLGAAVPALVVELQRPAVFDPAERIALHKSIATWNHHAASGAGHQGLVVFQMLKERMIPFVDEAAQLDEPPALTWLHQLAFAPQRPQPIASERVDWAKLRGRLVAVVMGLIVIASVYWAGYSLGRLPTATMSALVCATSFSLIFQARIATSSIAYTALAMLSIAAALWAMRPLRPVGSVARQVVGWATCGLALGAATLMAGSPAGPAVTFPLILIILLGPHRLTHLLGLIAAHGIAALLLVPWAAQVHAENPEIWAQWIQQLRPADSSWQAMFNSTFRRLLVVIVALLPWTLWLVGALALPFTASSVGNRNRLFIGWGWFIVTLTVLLVRPAGAGSSSGGIWGDLQHMLPDLLPIVPVAAILIGQQFSQYAELAAAGRYPRLWRILRWPHITTLVLASLGVASLIFIQQALVKQGLLPWTLVSRPAPPLWACLAAVLLGIIVLSVRYTLGEFPVKVVVCWVLWALVLAVVGLIPLARGPVMQAGEPIEIDTPSPAAETPEIPNSRIPKIEPPSRQEHQEEFRILRRIGRSN